MVAHRRFNSYIQCQTEYFTPGMQALLSDIDSAFDEPIRVFKDDPTSTVILVQIDGAYRVIKRTNTRHWTQVVRRIVSRSRGAKNWKNAKKLKASGINTFEPIAYVEKRFGPFKGPSYFISSFVDGTVALSFFLQEQYAKEWEMAAANIAKMISRLGAHQLSHRDLNLSNIILVDQQPWLIDLDSMRYYPFRFWSQYATRREWQRFLQNWQDVLSTSPKSQAFFDRIKQKYMPA